MARAREGIPHLALDVEGPAGRALTVGLGVRCPSVFKDAQRGRTERDRCQLLLVAPGESGSNGHIPDYDESPNLPRLGHLC